MTRKKKIIIIALLATVVLAGSIGGVALAKTGGSGQAGASFGQDVSANVSQPKTLLSRVAAILGIDQQKLEAAVTQAQSDIQTDGLKQRLQNMVAQGTITQAQADAYLKWWQSKPSTAPFKQQLKDWQESRPSVPPDLKSWEQAKPNIPMPGGRGGPGGRGFRGMRGAQRMGGTGGLTLPKTPIQ